MLLWGALLVDSSFVSLSAFVTTPTVLLYVVAPYSFLGLVESLGPGLVGHCRTDVPCVGIFWGGQWRMWDHTDTKSSGLGVFSA